jgi:hypothetical protein
MDSHWTEKPGTAHVAAVVNVTPPTVIQKPEGTNQRNNSETIRGIFNIA